ncbi:MAG: FecR family protein [Candidatus Cryptobacteroides sp.]
MSNIEDRILSFVMKHYEAGRLDASRAYERFCRLSGMEPENLNMRRFSTLASGRKKVLAGLFSVAAALAVIAAGIGLSQSRWDGYRAIDVAQKFTLPDSTEVVLAPGSELEFRMKRNARLARMSSGKVYFDVSRDESAPFSINAGDGYVRVLGTQFQVSRDDAEVRVDVSSGKVLFAAGNPGRVPRLPGRAGQVDSSASASVTLTAGMSAVLNAESAVPRIVVQKSKNFAVWASQEFVFDNTPLEDVVAELSGYYHKNINVTSSGEWRTRCLTARFSADDLQEILSIISSALDVGMEIQP